VGALDAGVRHCDTEGVRTFHTSKRPAVGLLVALGLSLVTALATVAISPEAGSTTIMSTSPVSASFLPSGEGWILTGYPCPTGVCIAVKRTMNDGRSWSSLPLPSGLRAAGNPTGASYFPLVPLNIYFADAKNGWIYGSAQSDEVAEIWSTHDGGATWSALDTKSVGMKFDVLAVSASRGSVYAISWLSGETFGLWRSSVTTDSWQRIGTPVLNSAAGGSNMEGALIFKGADGWLMLGNDRGSTASARLSSSGRWVKWTSPCANVGDSFSAPVANSATTLVDVCTIGGFGDDVAPGTPHYLKLQSNWVLTSHNAGLTFDPTSRVVADGSSEYLDQLPSLPASPASGTILVAKSVTHGLSTIDHLYLTRNGGKTWNSVYATVPTPFSPVIRFVSFASSSLGYAIVQRTTTTSALIVSTNGGLTWHASAT
jgi:photosystem II stability/assembly factor-like uncharacterized protein